jgi:hypothetical protein
VDASEEEPMDRPHAAEWLYSAEGAKRRARQARRAFWFPLLLFGALVLGAALLYRYPNYEGTNTVLPTRGLGRIGDFAGGFFLRDPGLVSWYWLLGLPFGYVVTVAYYRWRARRKGIASPVLPYVITGVALLGILIITVPGGIASMLHIPNSALQALRPGDLFVRGFTPLLTVALGLFVLAWGERSTPLALFAAGFFGLSLLVNLYDIENLFYRLNVNVPAPAIGLIVPGSILVMAGVGFWAVGRRAG